jgi:hypothetical protein
MFISSITKWVLELFETRGMVLEDALKKNLENAAVSGKSFILDELKKAPQINSLRPVRYAAGGLGRLFGKIKLSDHVERIQPKVLVDALFDLEGTATDWRNKVKNVITLLPEDIPDLGGGKTPFNTKKDLIKLVDQTYYSFDQWREKLETHFGSVMDQAGQKFAALAKTYALWISLIAAFILGVDSIQIAGRAWYDPQLTQKADAYAETILQSDKPEDEQQEDIQMLYDTLEDMEVVNLAWYVFGESEEGKVITNYPWYIRPPIEEGRYRDLISPYTKWSQSQADGLWFFLKILGIIITGIAVSQGSSFWYDLIRQIKGEQKKIDQPVGETPGTQPGAVPEASVRTTTSPPEVKPPQQ